MNRDHFAFGFLLGILIPLLGILLFYAVKYLPNNISISDFTYMVAANHYIIPKIISLGLLTCIPLITFYKNRRRYQTLKGIFVGIMIYAVMAILYKFNFL
jgi:uncharacterized BrkB/YihY/UPF0761 family membrane protein